MNCLLLGKFILGIVKFCRIEVFDNYVCFSKKHFLMKIRTKEDFCSGQIDFWKKCSLGVNFYQNVFSNLFNLNSYLKENFL